VGDGLPEDLEVLEKTSRVKINSDPRPLRVESSLQLDVTCLLTYKHKPADRLQPIRRATRGGRQEAERLAPARSG